MPATSSVLSVVVLVTALLSVLAFAFTAQNLRYMYLLQLEEKIARTQEVISAGVWSKGTMAIVEIRNIGGRGVYIKTLKITVGYTVVYQTGGQETRVALSYDKVYKDIHLSPYQTKIITFDILNDISLQDFQNVKDVYISYLTVIVATERNVFIFDPAPPMDSLVLEIKREDIGKGFSLTLPNGKVAQLKVYEYLFCSIGTTSRSNSFIDEIEATKVMIASSPDAKSVQTGFYIYGYDYKDNKFPSINIDIEADKEYNLKGGGKVNVTVCHVTADESLGGRVISVSRGVILLGTQLSGYDIVAVSFAQNPYPEYIDPSKLGGAKTSKNILLVAGRSNAYVTKIPLPDTDISVYDFLAAQVTPWGASNVQDQDTSIDIGTYYSQAILIGQSFGALLSGNGKEVYTYVHFNDPYPIIIVILPPPLEASS
jgi:hypothetical protein